MSSRNEVFITSHGTAYHKPGEHLFTGSSKLTVEKWTAQEAGYVPCSRCFPGTDPPPRPQRDGTPAFKELRREHGEG